jgi:hypothetical protein
MLAHHTGAGPCHVYTLQSMQAKVTKLQMNGQWKSNINVWFPFTYSQKWNCYFQNRIMMFCLPVPTLIYLWEIYIFPGSVCRFCCREICEPILGIHKWLTDTWLWKLGLRPRNFQKRNTYMGLSLQCIQNTDICMNSHRLRNSRRNNARDNTRHYRKIWVRLQYTVKKSFAVFSSSAGMSLTKLSLAGNNFPARESLVSDIPVGDGKTAKLFYSVSCTYLYRGGHPRCLHLSVPKHRRHWPTLESFSLCKIATNSPPQNKKAKSRPQKSPAHLIADQLDNALFLTLLNDEVGILSLCHRTMC